MIAEVHLRGHGFQRGSHIQEGRTEKQDKKKLMPDRKAMGRNLKKLWGSLQRGLKGEAWDYTGEYGEISIQIRF